MAEVTGSAKDTAAAYDFKHLRELLEAKFEAFRAELVVLRAVAEERDQRYNAQFKSAETAVAAALSAQQLAVSAANAAADKQTTTAFAAAEKAVTKAEEAQLRTNEGQNQFRQQLKDQAADLMGRGEANAAIKALEDKIRILQTAIDGKLTDLAIDIRALNEYRYSTAGKNTGASDFRSVLIATVGVGFGLFAAAMSLVGFLTR